MLGLHGLHAQLHAEEALMYEQDLICVWRMNHKLKHATLIQVFILNGQNGVHVLLHVQEAHKVEAEFIHVPDMLISKHKHVTPTQVITSYGPDGQNALCLADKESTPGSEDIHVLKTINLKLELVHLN